VLSAIRFAYESLDGTDVEQYFLDPLA